MLEPCDIIKCVFPTLGPYARSYSFCFGYKIWLFSYIVFFDIKGSYS